MKREERRLKRGSTVLGCLERISEPGIRQSFILFYSMKRIISHPRDQADEVNVYVYALRLKYISSSGPISVIISQGRASL